MAIPEKLHKEASSLVQILNENTCLKTPVSSPRKKKLNGRPFCKKCNYNTSWVIIDSNY